MCSVSIWMCKSGINLGVIMFKSMRLDEFLRESVDRGKRNSREVVS